MWYGELPVAAPPSEAVSVPADAWSPPPDASADVATGAWEAARAATAAAATAVLVAPPAQPTAELRCHVNWSLPVDACSRSPARGLRRPYDNICRRNTGT
ncbi:hypothetical protein GCM10020227_19630 [Streptomyces flavovirens]